MSHRCVNNSNMFWYICSQFTFKSQKRTITPVIKKAYELYFGCNISDHDENWAPHICCSMCTVDLWACIMENDMPFATPMIWRNRTTISQTAAFARLMFLDTSESKLSITRVSNLFITTGRIVYSYLCRGQKKNYVVDNKQNCISIT
jgi:hypothetical protein